jgi:sugar phosphate isomerase/epimerase
MVIVIKSAGEDPVKVFEDFFPWKSHVHLEDIAPSRVHQHLIAGEGAISYLKLFKTMSTLGCQSHIGLEFYPWIHPKK